MIEYQRALVVRRGIRKFTLIIISGSQVRVGVRRGTQRHFAFERADRFRVLPLEDQHSPQAAVADVIVGRDGHHLPEHFRRFLIPCALEVERSQPAIAGPIMGTQSNRSPIGAFRLIRPVELLEGKSQATVSVVAGRLYAQRPFKLGYTGIRLACAVVQSAQADVARGQMRIELEAARAR